MELKEKLTTQNVIIGLLTLAVIYLMYVNYNRNCDEKFSNNISKYQTIGTVTTKFAADQPGEKYVTADANGNLSIGNKLVLNNSGNVETSTNNGIFSGNLNVGGSLNTVGSLTVGGNLISNNTIQSISGIINSADTTSLNNGILLDNLRFTLESNTTRVPVIRSVTATQFNYNLQGIYSMWTGYSYPKLGTASTNNGGMINLNGYSATSNATSFALSFPMIPGANLLLIVLDTTNKRVYRITCNSFGSTNTSNVVTSASNEHVVTIERLFPLKL